MTISTFSRANYLTIAKVTNNKKRYKAYSMLKQLDLTDFELALNPNLPVDFDYQNFVEQLFLNISLDLEFKAKIIDKFVDLSEQKITDLLGIFEGETEKFSSPYIQEEVLDKLRKLEIRSCETFLNLCLKHRHQEITPPISFEVFDDISLKGTIQLISVKNGKLFFEENHNEQNRLIKVDLATGVISIHDDFQGPHKVYTDTTQYGVSHNGEVTKIDINLHQIDANSGPFLINKSIVAIELLKGDRVLVATTDSLLVFDATNLELLSLLELKYPPHSLFQLEDENALLLLGENNQIELVSYSNNNELIPIASRKLSSFEDSTPLMAFCAKYKVLTLAAKSGLIENWVILNNELSPLNTIKVESEITKIECMGHFLAITGEPNTYVYDLERELLVNIVDACTGQEIQLGQIDERFFLFIETAYSALNAIELSSHNWQIHQLAQFSESALKITYSSEGEVIAITPTGVLVARLQPITAEEKTENIQAYNTTNINITTANQTLTESVKESLNYDSANQTIKAFISSSFLDFQEERALFHQTILPALNKELPPHQLALHAMDMMYGANEAVIQKNSTLEVCLTEIDVCQSNHIAPYFISFIGERYGTILPPQKIKKLTFELICENADKSQLSVLKTHYLLDKNETDLAYVLTDSSKECFKYQLVEMLVQCTQHSSIPCLQLFYNHQLVSITEQEVNHALSFDTPEGVMFFIKRCSNNIEQEDYKTQKQNKLKEKIQRLSCNITYYDDIHDFEHLAFAAILNHTLNNLPNRIVLNLAQLEQHIDTHKKLYKAACLNCHHPSIPNCLDNNISSPVLITGDDEDDFCSALYHLEHISIVKGKVLVKLSLLLDQGIRTLRSLVIRLLYYIKIQALHNGYTSLFEQPFILTEAEALRELTKVLAGRSDIIIVIHRAELLEDASIADLFILIKMLKIKASFFLLAHIDEASEIQQAENSKIDLKNLFREKIPSTEIVRIELAGLGRKLSTSQLNSLNFKNIKHAKFYSIKAFTRWLADFRHDQILPSLPTSIKNLANNLTSTHGKQISAKTVKLLNLSEQGLTFNEILASLNSCTEVMREFKNQYGDAIKLDRLPSVVLYRLVWQLQDFVTNLSLHDTQTIAFKQNSITETLLPELNIDLTETQSDYRKLLTVFDNDISLATKRELSMLPIIYRLSGDKNNAINLVSSYEYLTRTLSLFDVDLAVQHFDFLAEQLDYKELKSISYFLHRNSVLINENPSIVGRLLVNPRFNSSNQFVQSIAEKADHPAPPKAILSQKISYFKSIDTYYINLRQTLYPNDKGISTFCALEEEKNDVFRVFSVGHFLTMIRRGRIYIFEQKSKQLFDSFEFGLIHMVWTVAYTPNDTSLNFYAVDSVNRLQKLKYNYQTKQLTIETEKSTTSTFQWLSMTPGITGVASTECVMSPNGKIWAEVENTRYGDNSRINFYHKRDDKLFVTFDERIKNVSFSPNSKLVVVCSDHEICTIDVYTGRVWARHEFNTYVEDAKFCTNNILLVGLQNGNLIKLLVDGYRTQVLDSVTLTTDFLKLEVYNGDEVAIYNSAYKPVYFYHYKNLFNRDDEQLALNRALENIIAVNANQVILSTKFDPRIILVDINSGRFKTVFKANAEGVGRIEFNQAKNKLLWAYHHVGGRFGCFYCNNESSFLVEPDCFGKAERADLNAIAELSAYDEFNYAIYSFDKKYIVASRLNRIYIFDTEDLSTVANYHIHHEKVVILFQMHDRLLFGDEQGAVEIIEFDIKHCIFEPVNTLASLAKVKPEKKSDLPDGALNVESMAMESCKERYSG